MKRIANKLWAVAIGIVLSIPVVAIAQDYFEASGIPVQRSAISSAQFRTEFSNIETKISDKLPALAGNGDNWVRVNAGGTALTSLTDAATVTALGVPSVGSSATITGAWTFENQLDIDNGNSLRIYDSTDTDFANFSHDGTDFNLAFTTTTDWNITGITTLAAGAVNADFAAITATTYGGITEANLVDKSAAETIAGAWTLPVASITAHEAAIDHDALSNFVANEHLDWTGDLGATNLHVNNAANGVLALAAGEVTQLSNIGATTITAGDWTAVAALVGTNTGDQTITLSGDVTGSGTGSFAATIAADAVTMDKIADIATDTFLGRVTASTGTVEVLSNAQAKTALDLTGTNSGDQTITLSGDVTGSGTGSFAATIANDAVSLAKMANMATASFLGRNTAATGDPEVLSATTARSILNVENGSTADQTSIVGISGTKAQFDTAVSDGNVAYTGGAHHDGFSDFVANEHLDWTSDLGATNLHRGNVQEFGSAATGGVPASGGGTDNYLRADGTWASPPGGGGEINDLTAAVTWTNVPNANITQASVTQHQAAINHDALSGFVANEHLDWTADLGATNLHSGNSANSVLALTSGEVTQLANIGATVISAADWTATAALVGTNTGDEAAASLTVQGIVELATIAETNTGTDAGRAVTPDGLDGWTGNSALVTSSNAALALTSGEVTQLANINATVVSTSDWTAVAALVGTNTGDQTITLTGNVTGSGTGSFAATIANDAVTLAKMANMATASFIGRTTAATGNPEVLSATTARSILNVENGAAADQTITLTGNVTGAGTGSFVATIANNAVSLAKMADIATDSFIGRDTAATGDPEVLSATTARSILNVENNSTADQTAGEIEAIVDHDLLVGFVGSEHVNHAAVAVTAGTGLSGGGTIETTRTINADIASETQQGISERATQAEVNAGTDTGRHITVSTLTNSALTTVNASAAEIGYKGSPLNTQNGDYTLVLGDAAKTIFKASGGAGETITIPANASVAFPIGTIIVILNGGGGTLLLAITTDTLTQAGTGDTGTRTLADDAMVSIIKVTATAWYLSGTGAT